MGKRLTGPDSNGEKLLRLDESPLLLSPDRAGLSAMPWDRATGSWKVLHGLDVAVRLGKVAAAAAASTAVALLLLQTIS